MRDFLNGFHATAVVYGQTGSGKTHSMFGDLAALSASTLAVDGKHQGLGLAPRAIREVLAALQKREEEGIEASLSLSYVEIFGNEGIPPPPPRSFPSRGDWFHGSHGSPASRRPLRSLAGGGSALRAPGHFLLSLLLSFHSPLLFIF